MGRRGRKGGKGYLSLENHSSNHQRNQLCSPVNSQEDSTGEMCDIFLGVRQPTCRKQPSSAGTGKERLCSAGVHSLTLTASDSWEPNGSSLPSHSGGTAANHVHFISCPFLHVQALPIEVEKSKEFKTKKITSTWPLWVSFSPLFFNFFNRSNCNSKTNTCHGLPVNKIFAHLKSQVEEIYISRAKSRSELHWKRTNPVRWQEQGKQSFLVTTVAPVVPGIQPGRDTLVKLDLWKRHPGPLRLQPQARRDL